MLKTPFTNSETVLKCISEIERENKKHLVGQGKQELNSNNDLNVTMNELSSEKRYSMKREMKKVMKKEKRNWLEDALMAMLALVLVVIMIPQNAYALEQNDKAGNAANNQVAVTAQVKSTQDKVPDTSAAGNSVLFAGATAFLLMMVAGIAHWQSKDQSTFVFEYLGKDFRGIKKNNLFENGKF